MEKMVQTAYNAGSPRDQVKQFADNGYIPFPWQWEFHSGARQADKENGPVDIGLGGARGPGKALSLDTLVPTEKGWTTMGDIKRGDMIFAPDGTSTKVTGISEVQNDRNCFKVCFSDGSEVIADEEHLWVTYTKQDRVALHRRTDEFRELRREKRSKTSKSFLVGKNVKFIQSPIIKTTRDILETLKVGREVNHAILIAKPIEGVRKELPIDPYVLGVWLGDGDKDRGYITCFDEGILNEIKDRGYDIRTSSQEGRYVVDRLHQELKETSLLKNKHIPNIYDRANLSQRLDLLRGLNDSDGYVDKDGAVEFTNTDKNLAQDYFLLVNTLGVRATKKRGVATLNGRVISDKWRIRYTANFSAFNLERKRERQKIVQTVNTKYRYIVDVLPVQSVPVRCITVAHHTHCFLIGKTFIPTHNSHAILSQIGLDDCQRVKGLKCLFLRKTGLSAKESFEDLIDKTLRGRISYEYASNVLRFPNGSRVLLGGFRDERDLEKYIGIEYDLIAIEELNQLQEERVLKLKGSLRTSKLNWRPRMYNSFNPGGRGHGWVKERYIIPFRGALEKDTRFYPSTYKSNVFLNKEYIDYLEGLQGDLGKAWREGEWDLFAGQYFTEWSENIHICKPFSIPSDWKKFVAIDYGYTAPSSMGWYAIDPDGTLYRYKEFYDTGHTGSQLGEKFVQLTNPTEKIQYIVCDPSFWAKRGESDNALSTAEKFERKIRDLLKSIERNELNPVLIPPALIRGNNDRLNGWLEVHDWLKPFEKDDKITARFQCFSTCTEFRRTFPALIHDEKRPEDVETNMEDHQGDEFRYAVMSRPAPSKSMEQMQNKFFELKMKQKLLSKRKKIQRV